MRDPPYQSITARLNTHGLVNQNDLSYRYRYGALHVVSHGVAHGVYRYRIYRCRALIGQQYRAYGYGTLIMRTTEDTPSQARALSNLNQLDAVSTFNRNLRPGRLTTLIKQPNAQSQHVIAD
jgi:hypothetical protein